MDLRKYGRKPADPKAMMSMWWYQPFIFSNDLACGVGPSWFMKDCKEMIMSRETGGRRFNKFFAMNQRMINMYEDWAGGLERHVDIKGSSVFELACNTGRFLMWLKEHGAAKCVGIDKADLDPQRKVLREITGIDAIEFRKGHWSPYNGHTIAGSDASEKFDITVCTSFIEHMSDPLNLINELAKKTNKALLLNAHTGLFSRGMNVTYKPMPHHISWGDTFPYTFDTAVSRELLFYSLKQCGFKKIIEVKYRSNWLPLRWCARFTTVVCLK